MNIVLTSPSQTISKASFSNLSAAPKINRPEGLLNSNYKVIVKANYDKMSSKSIFGIRQKIKSSQYQIATRMDTIIKLSVFVIVLAFAL